MSAAKLLPTSSKRKAGPVDFEDDCGFVFRRKAPKVEEEKKKKAIIAPVAVKTGGKGKTVENVPKKQPNLVEKTSVKSAPVVAAKRTAKKEPVLCETPVKKTIAAPAAVANEKIMAKEEETEMTGSINPTPSKKQALERQRRRRSSLSGLGLAAGRRRSSVGIGFTQDLPPQNVDPKNYHKHILPDLPGPLKMKQLLIWAVQKASKEAQVSATQTEADGRKKKTGNNSTAEWEELISEPLTQGLHKNELNTSWYQRPSAGSSTLYRPNPVNVDMKECHGLYQRYYKQLSTELAQWKALEAEHPSVPVLPIPAIEGGGIDPSVPQASVSHVDLVSVCKWLNRLPFHVDRLGWLLHVYGNFEGRSKQYCEDVFHQIFQRFFSAHKQPQQQQPQHLQQQQGTNPILVLKALSAAAPLPM